MAGRDFRLAREQEGCALLKGLELLHHALQPVERNVAPHHPRVFPIPLHGGGHRGHKHPIGRALGYHAEVGFKE